MAICSSKPLMSLQSNGETWLSGGPTSYRVFNYGPSVRFGRLGCGCVSKFGMRKKRELVVRGCGCGQGGGGEGDYVAEELDHEFVKVLREVQPYMSVHRRRVFVVILSAEIVASPYLDSTLKVPLLCL